MNVSAVLPLSRHGDAPVFLTGMRASGKSTLGPLLAKALNFNFVDLDVLICQAQGCSVGDIVAKGGWPAFRKLEAEALAGACAPSTVVATGGGAVLMQENRSLMRKNGIVIYLKAQPELLWQRLQADPKRQQRPSLNAATPYAGKQSRVASFEEIKVLLEDREAMYQEAAHAVADASLSLNKLCQAILAMLDEMAAKRMETERA